MTHLTETKGTNMKNTLLALLGFILLATPLAANAQFAYTTNNGTITITGYTGPGGAVTIPATITGLPVTTIGNYAFYNNTNLRSASPSPAASPLSGTVRSSPAPA